MKDKSTILDLLNAFKDKHENISWSINCYYSDGRGDAIHQIKITAHPRQSIIGIINFREEDGIVVLCMFKTLKKSDSENIVDMLLDLINYSKDELLL